MGLFDGADHDFRPLKSSEDVLSFIGFVQSVGAVVNFDDLTDSEAGNGWAGDKCGKVGFSTWDPDSEHGVNGDVSDSDGEHFVFDIIWIVGGLDSVEAGEGFGESFVGEVFEDILFVLVGFVSIDWGHSRVLELINVDWLNSNKKWLMFYNFQLQFCRNLYSIIFIFSSINN